MPWLISLHLGKTGGQNDTSWALGTIMSPQGTVLKSLKNIRLKSKCRNSYGCRTYGLTAQSLPTINSKSVAEVCRQGNNSNYLRKLDGGTMRPIKHAERGLTLIAGGLFNAIQSVNKYKPNPSFTPKWSDKPLLKSWQKSKPTLGWPRTTDSLCPNCVIEARESILSGKQDVSVLINEKVGEIKAQIIERDGEIWMVKDCPIHGHFEDMMAIDVEVSDAHREDVSRSRHRRAQRREASQPRHQHDQVWPRRGADGRPDESLQHDVRPVLHGRQPGWLRS